jgi:hypothetical protein
MSADSKQWALHGKIATILGVAIGAWLAWWYYVAVAAGPAPADGSKQSRSAPPQRSALHSVQAFALPADPVRTQLEQMDEHGMKRFYARCSQEGLQRRLDGGEAMACSVGYEVLLKKHFGGDFEQLLAWSRSVQAAEMR